MSHGFTTRGGGVSREPWGPLTLAAREDVGPDELLENWRRAVAALRGPEVGRVAVLSQVHGARVVEVVAPGGPLDPVAEADGAWTAEPELVLAVRVADCVPVLIAAPAGVAIAHAGWRGTAAGVVPTTVAALCAGTGCDPQELVAAIGPCISGASYEVGPEVVAGLLDAGLEPGQFLEATAGDRAYVDLGRAVVAQLRGCGVTEIDRVGGCTRTDPSLHSHRRDGPRSGRLAGLIARRA